MSDQFHERAELRVTPDAIPALREAMQLTLDDLAEPIRKLRVGGRMTESWLNDPVSKSVMAAYNSSVMDAADGMYQAVLKYREQLKAAVDALTEVERRYATHEAEQRDLILKLT